MERTSYLQDEQVTAFVDFIAALLSGEPFQHHYEVRDRRLPVGYEDRFGRHFTVATLEEAFHRYFWNGRNFADNQCDLTAIRNEVHHSISREEKPDGSFAALGAIERVMLWGAGGSTSGSLYKLNVAWAKSKGPTLPALLREGRECINSEAPDLTKFGVGRTRMNAGYTKYFSLACRESIIYDGRVGAALGLLVRRFCETTNQPSVPGTLLFGWCPQNQRNSGRPTGPHRNPSANGLIFPRMNPTDSKNWARRNIQANWILRRAMEAAKAPWCSGPDCLRKVEAALFMIGYDIP